MVCLAEDNLQFQASSFWRIRCARKSPLPLKIACTVRFNSKTNFLRCCCCLLPFPKHTMGVGGWVGSSVVCNNILIVSSDTAARPSHACVWEFSFLADEIFPPSTTSAKTS